MNREDKDKLIEGIAERLKDFSTVYVTDISHLTVEKTSKLRRACYAKGIVLQVAKNTLIRKAMEKVSGEYAPIHEACKGSSALMFSNVANDPAKLIKEFRKTHDKPLVKGAFIESSVYLGDSQLDFLVKIKSKNELIGELIGLLQSPAKNVISALQSGGGKLAGIVKTLSERKES